MRTSDRLYVIAVQVRLAIRELRRLSVDLPDGQTLEIVNSVEVALVRSIRRLNDEAAQLRHRFRD